MNTSGELRTLINTKTIEFFNYNRFSDIKKINNGGYGEVYSAIYRPETEKMSEKMSEEMHEEIHVALKKLFTELDFDKKASEEFVKEVKHLHKVDHHSYINRLLGITQEPVHNHYVMVLQYANGGNLHEYLRNNFDNDEYKLEFVEQICFAKDIALGMKFLHKENIIHRDLHSKNILIHNQKVMIADLGLSKLCNDDLKKLGQPQCVWDSKYVRDFKSDIYSLGVLYWELTTGRVPFQDANVQQIFLNISDGLRETPNPITPIEFINLYKRCWDSDPKNRPQINEVYDIVSNIKSIIIVNLSQEFIKLYIKDMVTNSDDSVNNINNWLENNSENSKKIFDFVINTDVLIEHRETILAYFYMKGFGTNKDYNECLYWCKKGCEKKDVYSYYEAAFCYRYSYKNYNEAFHYFNLAASGGVLKAKSELAMMHLHGMGCEENKTKAFYLFKEAGEQDKIACCLISDCYYDGIGIEINLIEALKYYKIFWEKWHYYNAKIRIPLIEEKLEIPIEQRCNLR
ncbi:kinase-like domain-containing protein [Gigaspora rosea]|uniref:Kinase-like domain-containing protein n=1 Tax=Gigaspora rosea TaxID=44941 RepID=A0A397VL60_9GLOM|nr:kinase-like domain-containing protein [Gigaspora rosea]